MARELPPIPDLDQFEAVRSEAGCSGCCFWKERVRCSAIPCVPSVARPYFVTYRPRKPADAS